MPLLSLTLAILYIQSFEARESGMGISLFWRLSEAHPQAISALRCQVSRFELLLFPLLSLLLPMPHIFFLVKISFVPVNSCLETTFLQYRMSSGIMELSNSLIYGNRLCCGSLEIANAKLKFSGKQQVHFKFKEVTLPFA